MAAGNDFTLEIRTLDANGVPTDSVLASDSISDVPPVVDPNSLTLTGIFDPPAEIETGNDMVFSATILV